MISLRLCGRVLFGTAGCAVLAPSWNAGAAWHGRGDRQAAYIGQAAASAASLTGVLVASLAAIPIAGPIAARIAAIGLALANVFSGCGQTCIQATSYANQAEPLLLQNLQQYMAAPVHYASLQAAALNNFELTWTALQQACSSPSLGSAGQACISDRQQGSCAYKTSAGGWQQNSDGSWTYVFPGANGSGSTCWNWFVGYHDPIANDPTVVPDPIPGAAALSSITRSLGIPATIAGIPTADLLIGGGALLLLALLL